MPVVLLLRSEEVKKACFSHGLYLSPDLMSKRTQQEQQGLLLQGGISAFVAFAILEKLDETERILMI